MNLSLRSMKIVYWLVTLNVMLGFVLAHQLRPEIFTWQIAIVQTLFYIIGAGLFVYVSRVFPKAINAASPKSAPRFNSRIKTQLWGLLIRAIWGAIGLGFIAVVLPLQYDTFLFTLVVYAVVMIGGFINDGRGYDKHHI